MTPKERKRLELALALERLEKNLKSTPWQSKQVKALIRAKEKEKRAQFAKRGD